MAAVVSSVVVELSTVVELSAGKVASGVGRAVLLSAGSGVESSGTEVVLDRSGGAVTLATGGVVRAVHVAGAWTSLKFSKTGQ